MTSEAKFKELNMQFESSGTRMALEANIRESNMHFMSQRTGMTQHDKFEDRWYTLLFYWVPTMFRIHTND